VEKRCVCEEVELLKEDSSKEELNVESSLKSVFGQPTS